MYAKAVILFCATIVVTSHEIEITTPTPVITSYSSPAPPSHAISNTYLPVPASTEVKIGNNYNKHSISHSSYVPVHTGHSAYKPVSSYGGSWNYASTTQATPYSTVAPVYSTTPFSTVAPVYSSTPVNYQSWSSFGKSYPTPASYAKSTYTTVAPSYSYNVASHPVSHVASYPSQSYSYAHKPSYSQPISYYNAAVPTFAPASYVVSPSTYSSYVSYPSPTPAPSFVSSTLGYDSSSALAYSVAPSVASYSSPSYSIQEAPLKAQFSYAVSSASHPAHEISYGGDRLFEGVGVPYHGQHAVQYVSEPNYSYSAHHGKGVAYSSFPGVSHGYGQSLNYGWKK